MNFARFVQLLPASEAHHHAGPGGLLDHSLEVAVAALKTRRGLLLPSGASPEAMSHVADGWTYAVFTAALLHDIGKVVTQQRVTLSGSSASAVWLPWHGAMPLQQRYQLTFNRDRRYAMHKRVNSVLVQHVLSHTAMAWLASNTEILHTWLACLSGDKAAAGVLGDLVTRSDGLSVAANLGAHTPRFNGTPTSVTPLHEKLLTSLRQLLASGESPLNRNGAAGWLVDDTLWMVSKRTADALREQLAREGHDGIPTRNDRLFDVLQEHRVLVANGEQAIWRARVKSDAWNQAHDLTLLRFHAATIWPSMEARPAAFEGEVTPLTDDDKETKTSTSASTGNVHKQKAVTDTSPVITHDTTAEKENTITANPFVRWLIDGINDHSLSINAPNARIHTVDEGLLLVSPAIFRDFARHQGDEAGWEKAQKKFLKLKIHCVAEGGTNLFHYRIEKSGGNFQKQEKVIKGLLIDKPADVLRGIELPTASNGVLRKV